MMTTLFFGIKNITLHMLKIGKFISMDNQLVIYSLITLAVGGFIADLTTVMQPYVVPLQVIALIMSITLSTIGLVRWVNNLTKKKDGT